MKKFLLLTLVFVFNFVCNNSIQAGQLTTKNVGINEVAYETEEGYVDTDAGLLKLPDQSTKVDMKQKAYNLLIHYLKKAEGGKAVLFLHDDIVVGISSKEENINFRPKFKERKFYHYNSPPEKIRTILQYWDTDTYRLSLNTSNGTFCILNDFKFKIYYENVYKKLKNCCEKATDQHIPIVISYHREKDSYECSGKIEDISFPR